MNDQAPPDDLAAFERLVRARRSVKGYDAAHAIDDATLRHLFRRGAPRRGFT